MPNVSLGQSPSREEHPESSHHKTMMMVAVVVGNSWPYDSHLDTTGGMKTAATCTLSRWRHTKRRHMHTAWSSTLAAHKTPPLTLLVILVHCINTIYKAPPHAHCLVINTGGIKHAATHCLVILVTLAA